MFLYMHKWNREEGKNQESTQLFTTPDQDTDFESDKNTKKHHILESQ